MQHRQLGNSDLSLSEIGLGCWQFGGDFGPIKEGAVNDIIQTALENKIDFFDTADVYGAGRSEALIGNYFQQHKGTPVIATKYGRGAGTYPDNYTLLDLSDSIKRAQDRLQVHCIDLLQLHCIPTEVMRRGEIFDHLRKVQQQGHIRYFGASVETVEEGLICAQQPDLTSLQVIFNIFRQKLVDELLPTAKANQIGVIVRLPLASGMLSGKYTEQTQFAETDHRNYNRNGEAFSVGETFAGIPFKKGLELVEELKEMVPEGLTLAQMAMRWILDHPEVTAVIPGASSAKQAQQNAACSALSPLPQELHEKLSDFYKTKVAQHIRGVY